jgi:hypothetical protein
MAAELAASGEAGRGGRLARWTSVVLAFVPATSAYRSRLMRSARWFIGNRVAIFMGISALPLRLARSFVVRFATR